MMLFILACLGVICCYWYFQDLRRGKYRPPGPPRLPMLGNMIQIAKANAFFSHLAFHKLSQKFGGLMRLKVGFQDVVVVSDFKIMQDMLAKDVFSGRHYEGYMKERTFNKDLGIIFTSGEMWNVLRKFTVRNLRDYGFGKKQTMECTISGEIFQFIAHLKRTLGSNNERLRVERIFHLSLLNILWSMVGGKTFSHEDPQLLRLLKLNEDVMKSGNFGANIAFAFPFVAKLLPSFTGLTLQRKHNGSFQNFVRELFAEYRKNGQFTSQPSSYIDACLAEIEKNLGNPDSYMNEEQLLITIIDLFQVGSETTGNTLSYALLFMMLNPEVQEKVFNEIDSTFPNGSLPTYDERKLLPYTEATILETLRLGYVVPLPPPRKAMVSTSYGGYFFPKETIVTMNYFSVLMDEEYWGDPHSFRPERFLGESPNALERRERAEKVFGFGKRICLGEDLAKMSLFLYFTACIRNFKFCVDKNEPPPSITPLPGFILQPPAFNALVIPRKQE